MTPGTLGLAANSTERLERVERSTTDIRFPAFFPVSRPDQARFL